mgnify:CR=1 FL=1
MERGVYNTRPRAVIKDILYIGREIPTKSDQYPNIVHEPLKAMYNEAGDKRLKPGMRVSIYVYSSGIVVQEVSGKINWFPIQNLYCSAGLVPQKSKSGLTFKHLDLQKPSKSKPLFAMVVRQTADIEGQLSSRRVLMCHGFIVDDQRSAKLLIAATEQAYKNKDGWNHPMNDRQFMSAKINFTMSRIDEGNEEMLEELKGVTIDRDTKLAQQRPSEGGVAKSKELPRQASTKMTIVSPRSAMSTMPRSQSAIVRVTTPQASRSASMMVRPSARPRTPPHPDISRTFITNGVPEAYIRPKATSMVGFPISRSASKHSRQEPYLNGGGGSVIPKEYHRSRVGPKSRRQRSAPATPKHRRILASSEPTEPINGLHNGVSNRGSHLAIVDWDQMLNADEPSQRHSRKSKPSSQEQNGLGINVMRNGRVKVSCVYLSHTRMW